MKAGQELLGLNSHQVCPRPPSAVETAQGRSPSVDLVDLFRVCCLWMQRVGEEGGWLSWVQLVEAMEKGVESEGSLRE